MRSYTYDILKNDINIKKKTTKLLSTEKIKKNKNLQLLNFFNKVGYKKNFLKKLLKWASFLYSKNNLISDEFNFNIKKDNKYNNINFLLNSIFEKSKINFKITCVEVDKKYRKKLKKKYTFQLKYLNNIEKKRLFFFKNLKHIISKDYQATFFLKINNILTGMILNFKKSEIYKLKILTLKQLTKKNKTCY